MGKKLAPGGSDVLLRFLIDNAAEPQAVKMSNNRLFDILKRNLAEATPWEQWGDLGSENRPVQVVTSCDHVWTLSTTVVHLSDAMSKLWVTKASNMWDLSKKAAFWVRIVTCC